MISTRTSAWFVGKRAVSSAAVALLALGATVGVAAPASAAAVRIHCPSAACVQLGSGLGGYAAEVTDGAGSMYLTYGYGDLRKVNLTTGAASTVATGLGNLRGVAVDGANAYVVSYDGTIQSVNLATGSHSTLASGLQPLFGVARHGSTTYATDARGELIAVPDGGSARVVAGAVGFSEGIAFSASGAAYTADMMSGNILETDLGTGASQILASQDYEPTSITVGNDGLIYVLVAGEVMRVNPATGQQANVSDIDANIFSLSFTASGTAYAVDENGNLWRLAGVTGQ
ncbi:hypothetical protein [Catenulispora rubra]|uniref:hypothetical protein n=1 Tax=Catenulispora rubra TaxID=280293 RepID=UPI001E5BBA0B|nr:hypothetical protein [Catenulispora rubra]